MPETTDENVATDEVAPVPGEAEPEVTASESDATQEGNEADVISDDDSSTTATETRQQTTISPALTERVRRVNKVPVNLIVRIAERKLELEQLRDLAPGSLLMFDKSYDSPLDVYVDNQLYCRGEAVKIGETFGVRISESNSKVVREKKVHQV